MSEAIYPGTTPVLDFEFPDEIEAATCQRIAMLLTQGDRVILRKETPLVPPNESEIPSVPLLAASAPTHKGPFDIDGQIVSCRLTQDETRMFRCYPSINLELWVKTGSGNVPDPWMTSIPIGRTRDDGAV